ncbi:MAG TPA: hypothetical protein VFD27_20460 [Chthoniobacteraceae bacterium]|nr:hypothetical protein [Chthoniobacteraceae bacterium]
MQLLSLAVLGPEAQRLLEDFARTPPLDLGRTLLLLGGLSAVFWIVGAWIGAHFVAVEKPGVGEAIKTGLMWSLGFAVVLLLAGAAFYFAKVRGSALMATASLIIGGILLFYAALSVPMQVHKIDFRKALGLFVGALLVHAALQLAIHQKLGDPLALAQRFELFRRFYMLPAEDAAAVLAQKSGPAPDGPSAPVEKSIAERHEELKKVYADLLVRREGLKSGDDAALVAYNRDTASYIKALEQLQRDSDAQKK